MPAAAPQTSTVPDEGRDHCQEGSAIVYDHYLPSSGSTTRGLLVWQYYDRPQPEGYWVHNLEHGGIVVLYNCAGELCPEVQIKLQGLYDTLRKGKYG